MASSSSSSSLAASFKYPDVYHLPPFFTIQPVAATREKQLGMWCDLLARFVRHSRRQSFAVAADAGLVRPACFPAHSAKQYVWHRVRREGYQPLLRLPLSLTPDPFV